MSRIDDIFANLRARNQRALMPYLTVGDPSIEATGAMLPAIEQAGASICELGVPFSDPIADGPVIDASMTYALGKGLKIRQILEMVAQQRSRVNLGIVAMVSWSIVHRLGPKAFIRDCAQAGFDGFIFPDLPVEQAGAASDMVRSHGLVMSLLIAPTTSDQRAARIARMCSGFIYLVSRAGITGERTTLPPDLAPRIERLRQVTDLPIAVGFGISAPQHVREVTRVADAAIVGSALVRRMAEHRNDPPEKVAAVVGELVRELAGGLTCC